MTDYDDDGYRDIWESYGLSENPFSTNPLLVQGGVIPITCFIGRSAELSRINKQFRSKGGTRTMVVGDVGVGKTSFVNYARYLARDKYFSPIKEIPVQETWDSEAMIVNTLYAIANTLTINGTTDWIDKKTFTQIESLVTFNRVSSRGIGISAVIGFDYNQETTNPTNLPFMALEDLFASVINQIYDKTGRETIIHYNNLENLAEKSIRRIFENLRNTFQIAHVHFVFIGNLIVDGIIQSIARVSSIFSEHIMLNTMSLPEVEEIIETRLSKMKISAQIIKPYDDKVLEILYKLYNGNIRDILNSLSTAVLAATQDKPILLTEDTLSIVLRDAVEKRFLSNLSPKAKEILKVILNAKKGEITNRGIAELAKVGRPNVSTYIHQELEKYSCVHLKRKNGKDKFWAVRPEIKWMLLNPAPSDIRQNSIKPYIK
jgi:GTPase SAR1 family protein